jgi:hypothetical protein
MNADSFFKAFFRGTESVGKVMFAAIVGAFIMALTLLGCGLMNDYFANNNTRTFAPVMGAILGFLAGGIIGGFIGIIRPNPKKALYTAIIISVILLIIGLFIDFQSFSGFVAHGSYSMIYAEIIFLIGLGTAFVLCIWIPAKVVSSI